MDLAGLCLEYVNGKSTTESPKVIGKAISNGQVALVTLVEALEIYLTSTNVDNRSLGTNLLSEVLTQLDPGCLNSDEVHYIIEFYCDRLKDKAVVIPHVLIGIHTLVMQYFLDDSDVVLVCRMIFKEVYNQSQQFPQRRLVYSILNHFLMHQLPAIQLMSSDFVVGYIQAIDGEQDPRNLLTVFNSVYVILRHLQFDALVEDLFEVTSCYFPIDFTPPANDPSAVSKESLVLALRKCLTATDKFADFCLPLLLDKLTSDLTTAKLDSLSALSAGASIYGASKLHPFLQPIWTAIKREMYQSIDEQVQAACLEALTALTKALSQPLQLSSSHDVLGLFIAMVLKDCGRHLAEPELRLIAPTVSLLKAIAVASDPACSHVTASVLPVLVHQASVETQVPRQRVVLEALLGFITAMMQSGDGEASSPLLVTKDALLKLLMSASTHNDSSIRAVAITTIGALLQIHGALKQSETLQFSEHLKLITLSDCDLLVREAGCAALSQLASVQPNTVRGHLLPSLLPLLSDTSATGDVVNLLSSLCVADASMVELCLPPLVDVLAGFLSAPSPDLTLVSSISSALLKITRNCISWVEFRELLSNRLLQQLVAICVMSCDVISPLLENIVAIVSLFTQAVDERLSQSLLTWLVKVLVTGELSVSESVLPLPPLSLTTPPTQSQLISFLTAVLGAADKQLVAQFSGSLFPVLKQLSLYSEHEFTSRHAAMICASILNKLPQEDSTLSVIEKEMVELWSELNDTQSSSSRQRALNLWVWLCKALLMRGHPVGMDAVLKLLSLCGSGELGAVAADGFKVLLADSQYVLNIKCHAIIRLFYKQQTFTNVVPKLVEMFKSPRSGDFRQDHLLRALSHLMEGVPKEVLLAELPTVLPLLLESLGSEEVALKLSTLKVIHSLISDAPHVIEKHVPDLLPRLLMLACDPASMKVRISSLSCIGSLTSLSTHIVYPYQSSVINDLELCLDDHKRLVRKEAVNARSLWYLLGTAQ